MTCDACVHLNEKGTCPTIFTSVARGNRIWTPAKRVPRHINNQVTTFTVGRGRITTRDVSGTCRMLGEFVGFRHRPGDSFEFGTSLRTVWTFTCVIFRSRLRLKRNGRFLQLGPSYSRATAPDDASPRPTRDASSATAADRSDRPRFVDPMRTAAGQGNEHVRPPVPSHATHVGRGCTQTIDFLIGNFWRCDPLTAARTVGTPARTSLRLQRLHCRLHFGVRCFLH